MKITFRNKDQLILWKLEILGQLSDGFWENFEPYDHWRDWADAEADVGEIIGRDFVPLHDEYDLADPSLTDVVGDRMLRYVRFARAYGIEAAKELEHFYGGCGVDDFCEMPQYEGEYWDDVRQKLAKYDEKDVKRIGEDESTYSLTQLRGDLYDMSFIMSTKK